MKAKGTLLEAKIANQIIMQAKWEYLIGYRGLTREERTRRISSREFWEGVRCLCILLLVLKALNLL